MRRYLQLMEQGLVKEAQEWLNMYNYWAYLNTKPIETLDSMSGVEAARELVERGVKDA